MPDGLAMMTTDASDHDTRVRVGTVSGAHGVRGLVRVVSHTAAPGDLTAYGRLSDAAGRPVDLEVTGESRGQLLARIAGVDDRDAAERWRNAGLFIARDQLPAPDDAEEFYHADLVGLAAETADGTVLGTVRAIFDFGAGDMLEIVDTAGDSRYLPFTHEVVPSVEPAAGRLVVDPPVEVGEPEPAGGEAADDAGEDAP